MDNRNIILSLIFLSVLIVSTSSVFAFGISSPYWKNNPLEMLAGQEKEISFNLQNCPSLSEKCTKSDVNVNAELEQGSEITEITSGSNYQVPYGTANTNLLMKITTPSNASPGDNYNVRLSVTSPPEDTGGNIQLGVKYTVDFPVIIVQELSEQTQTVSTPTTTTPTTETKKTNTNVMMIAIIPIIAIIIIVVIIFLVKRKRQV